LVDGKAEKRVARWVVEMQRYNVGNYNSINALSAILLRLLSCILRLLMPTYTFSQYSKHMIRSRKIAQGEWAGGKRGGKGWVSWSPRTWKFNRHRTKLNDRASCLRRKAQTWKSGRWEEKARRNGGVAFGSPRCNQLMCERLVFAKGPRKY